MNAEGILICVNRILILSKKICVNLCNLWTQILKLEILKLFEVHATI